MTLSEAELATFGPFRLVVVQPTPFCNLDCDYCYLPQRGDRQRLDLSLIEPLFRNLFTSRFLGQHFTVCWHAGEPLSVPLDFYRAAFAAIQAASDRYNDRGCHVTHAFQTNGVLINQEWCDFFRSFPISVGVSIDGPAFLHDAHRKTRTGKGTHEATLRGIRLLQANQVPFHIIAVITAATLDHADALFDFFWEAGIYNIGFNVEEVEGANTTSSLAATVGDRYHRFMERLWQRTKATHGKMQVREFDRISESLYRDRAIHRNQLCTPFAMVNVDVNGNFSTYSPELLGMTSERYGRFIFGNVREHGFESVCHTPKFLEIYNEVQQGVEACRRTCEYFGLCGGGAPSNKFWEHGHFSATETLHCRYTRKALVDLILADVEAELGLVSG